MTTRLSRLLIASLAVCLQLMVLEVRTGAQVAVTNVTSVNVKPKLSDFDQAASSYFRASDHGVAVIRERLITEDDLPVVLFIAQRADQDPATVAALRLRRFSWWDIAARYHLSAEVFYVPMDGASGPAYGRAYSYFRNKPRSQWNSIVLGDDDIVNLVQLRFLSEFYRVSPSVVMDARERSGDFVAVQRAIASRGGR